MKDRNTIIRGTKEVLDRWMTAKIPISLEGVESNIHPQYLSALIRRSNVQALNFVDGIMIEEKPLEDSSTGMKVVCHVGKDERGSGVSYGNLDGIPLKEKPIKRYLDEVLDQIIKVGGNSYLTGIGESIINKVSMILQKHDYGNPVNYQETSRDNKITGGNLVEDIARKAKELHNLNGVIRSSAEVCLNGEDTLLVDTIGNDIEQYRELLSLSFSLAGERNNPEKTLFETSAMLYFNKKSGYNSAYLDRKIEKLIHNFEESKSAITMKGGHYPIIMDGTAAAVLIHEALAAHLLSGKYIAEGDSTIFSERMGDQIMAPYLSIIDDPTLERGIGSYRYDEEGVEAKKVVLVEDGILKNYLLDRGSASKLEQMFGLPLKSNGRARSEWITDNPEPRVTNLLIESKELVSKEELFDMLQKTIKDQGEDYGLMIEGGGGQVDVEDGVFTLYPSGVWRVDPQGKKERVKGLRIVGSADEFLTNIIATGEPYSTYFGMCGANSGYVTTQERAPSFLLPQVSAISDARDNTKGRILPRMESYGK
jgi:predicted Zn-dependent protease